MQTMTHCAAVRLLAQFSFTMRANYEILHARKRLMPSMALANENAAGDDAIIAAAAEEAGLTNQQRRRRSHKVNRKLAAAIEMTAAATAGGGVGLRNTSSNFDNSNRLVQNSVREMLVKHHLFSWELN